MAKRIGLYCDVPWLEKDKPSNRQLLRILKYLGADEVRYLYPSAQAGFGSGLDWQKLVTEEIVAVVLRYVTDACILGMSVEAEVLKYGAYELNPDGLYRLHNLAVTGRELKIHN